jgi:uncharacterized iron-regulated protein
MKIIDITLVLVLTIQSVLSAQDKPAYMLYNNRGETVEFSEMTKELSKADMIFFGEYHTNPISHWLQIELAKGLYEIKGDKLYFGAEMFENGNQLVLDEYLAGYYPEKKMLGEITQLWSNYQTDYKPLVEFAKQNNLRFIATNIPRRYASMINKYGMRALDSLSPQALSMIGPLKKYFDASVYNDMKDKMGGHVPTTMKKIQMAQASKDATMAKFCIESYQDGDLLLHIEGAYHSDYDRGIIWWVNSIKPNFKIKSISTVLTSEWKKMTKEQKNTIANYIIVIADNMTQTNR